VCPTTVTALLARPPLAVGSYARRRVSSVHAVSPRRADCLFTEGYSSSTLTSSRSLSSSTLADNRAFSLIVPPAKLALSTRISSSRLSFLARVNLDRQDHASGRRTQQPAQQAAEDQRRTRGGQGGEEAVQVRERLYGVPRAVAPRDQAVRAHLQQVSISSFFISLFFLLVAPSRHWKISMTPGRNQRRRSDAFSARYFDLSLQNVIEKIKKC